MDPTDTRPRWRPARDTDDTPPPRPTKIEPADLRFTPQDAVRWYSPGVLTGSGLHVGLTSVFGSFLDKRELQARKPTVIDRSYAGRDELWIDYTADTGDGFPATMTVASQLGRRSPPQRNPPRGTVPRRAALDARRPPQHVRHPR